MRRASSDNVHPGARSAACLVRWAADPIEGREADSLLLCCGDTGVACRRLNDVWELSTAGGADQRWKQLHTKGDSPEPRSNAAVACIGRSLYIFGGWNAYDVVGTTPLGALAILDLPTLRWLPGGRIGGNPPCPRGQPTLVAATDGRSLTLFGGWDGARRFDDMHRLDLVTSTWSQVRPASGETPPARADHSLNVWHYCDDGVWKDLLICFGGSTHEGPQNDLWLYDTRWDKWTQAFCAGGGPSPRSSHAAAVLGDTLLVMGGQFQAQVFSDCHILCLVTLSWRQVEIPGLGEVCRHSLAFAGDRLWGAGGFDGQDTLAQTFCVNLEGLGKLTADCHTPTPHTFESPPAAKATPAPEAPPTLDASHPGTPAVSHSSTSPSPSLHPVGSLPASKESAFSQQVAASLGEQETGSRPSAIGDAGMRSQAEAVPLEGGDGVGASGVSEEVLSGDSVEQEHEGVTNAKGGVPGWRQLLRRVTGRLTGTMSESQKPEASPSGSSPGAESMGAGNSPGGTPLGAGSGKAEAPISITSSGEEGDESAAPSHSNVPEPPTPDPLDEKAPETVAMEMPSPAVFEQRRRESMDSHRTSQDSPASPQKQRILLMETPEVCGEHSLPNREAPNLVIARSGDGAGIEGAVSSSTARHTAICSGELQDIILRVRSGELVPSPRELALDSRLIACSIAQGSPLKPEGGARQSTPGDGADEAAPADDQKAFKMSKAPPMQMLVASLKEDAGEPEPPSNPEPFTLAELPAEDQQLTGWRMVKRIHEAAVADERDSYVDPASGYTVFTSRYLGARPCCGNKCRHCPWKHANVKKQANEEAQADQSW